MGRVRPRVTSREVFDDHVLVPSPRDAAEDRALTIVLLAGERLARGGHGGAAEGTRCVPATYPGDDPSLEREAADLVRFAGFVTRYLDAHPSVGTTLETLGRSLGAGPNLAGMLACLYPGHAQAAAAGRVRLSDNEQKVVVNAAAGYPREYSARVMGLAPKTVDRHLANAYGKLGVHRPGMAAMRAASVGALTDDRLRVWWQFGAPYARLASRSGFFAMNAVSSDMIPGAGHVTVLRDTGAALLAASAATTREASGDGCAAYPAGALCDLGTNGAARRIVLDRTLEACRSIAVAPPASSSCGFVPGHIYVAHDLHPQYRLNRAAIAEVTPHGRVLRTFCGAQHVAARLIGPVGLAFSEDGRLLATSGWLTDALLEFTQGGSRVRRLTDGAFTSIASAPDGTVIAANVGFGMRSVIERIAADGSRIGSFGGCDWGHYEGVAVTADGSVLAAHHIGEQRAMSLFDPSGAPVSQAVVTGHGSGILCCGADSAVCVPCFDERRVRIVTPAGASVRDVDCSGIVRPLCAAASRQGTIYAAGEADD